MAQVKMISEPKDSEEEKKQDKPIQDPGSQDAGMMQLINHKTVVESASLIYVQLYISRYSYHIMLSWCPAWWFNPNGAVADYPGRNCWCPGSLCGLVISSYGIKYVG